MLILAHSASPLRTASLLLLTACLSGVTACQSSAGADETSHPTPENIPRDRELASIVGIRSVVGPPDSALARLAHQLGTAHPVATIGTADGSERDVFGLVEDIVVDESGRIIVLDSRTHQLRFYDRNGRYLSSFGRSGNGPNEFGAPTALELDASGRFVVMDRYNRLKIFAPASDSVEYVSSVLLDLVPEDLCVTGDQYLVQAWRADGGIVHLYAGEQRLRSFGRPYKTDNALVENQMSDGPIACNDAGVVVVSLKYLPLVFGYDGSGRMSWVSRISDFTPMQISEVVGPNGKPGIRFAGDDYDYIERLVTLPSNYFLVQVGRESAHGVEQRVPFVQLHTYLFDGTTGRGVYVGAQFPVLHVFHGNRLYGSLTDPYPQVKIYEVEGDLLK
jgi:hypothetical protein